MPGLVELMRAHHDATVGDCGLEETLATIRDEMRKFADSEVVAEAQKWHRTNSYIPLEIIAQMSELGVFGLTIPEEFGGANLPYAALMGVYEEQARTCVPFTFPPDSPNLHMLIAVANEEQRKKYLEPYARGEAHSAIAISEPGAGGDPAGMTTRAVRDGDDWVINGRKIWVSRVPQSDFTIVMARTG